MAATATGTRLTEQHRRDQLTIRTGFLRQLLRLWPLLNPRRLEDTAPAWLDLVLPLMVEEHQRSATRSLTYYEEIRTAELDEPAPRRARLVDLDALDTDAARSSLIVTGPANIKSKTGKGMDPDEAAKDALVAVSGAASRHVLNGGRQALVAAGDRDEGALAFARVTDAKPCWWCAMMTSRGPVYRNRESAGRSANDRFVGDGLYKFHDHCGCTVEPVFTEDAEWPGHGRTFEDLWARSTRGKSGQAARNAFRRAIEGRSTPEDPISAA